MKNFTVRNITDISLMLSMILVLSTIEQMFAPLPLNMRFGLSNVVVMYALFFIGGRSAFTLAILKSAFVLLVRGPVAGALSLSGGLFSLFVIASLAFVWRNASYFVLSVSGAVAHNLAQIAVASLLVSTNLVPVYLPILCVMGVAAGSVTAVLLRVAMPIFRGSSVKSAADRPVSET
ncbi:MAG: Gx transporter family protein [Synergistaceae bacterium]|jgi:heptaprenyl diphosphate synthase|nr:Gx transporter family protein [Synergistaceae bacterium]